MTFQEIWDQLCRKQPLLTDAKATVEFKPENLQLLLRQVYEQGQNSNARRESILDAIRRPF